MSQFSSHRVLIIFTNEASETLKEQQLNLLNKDTPGVKERDLKVIVVEKQSALRRKYKVAAADFTVVLVGKDGSEKFRTEKVLQLEKLFSIIDAMPMRRSEMKKN